MTPEKSKEIETARAETQLALLKAIPDAIEMGTAANVLRLAEAFAWVRNPSGPHGGGANPSATDLRRWRQTLARA